MSSDHVALCHDRQLLFNNWIGTLNAALRHVAKRDNIPLVDLETLLLQLPAAHCYSVDGIHPHGKLLATVFMNLVLNIYEQDASSSVVGTA